MPASCPASNASGPRVTRSRMRYPLEPFGARRSLTERQDQPPHALSVCGAGARTSRRCAPLRFPDRAVVRCALGPIASSQCCAAAPATTPRKIAIDLRDEIHLVLDELRVEPHDRPARRDVPAIQKWFLEFRNGGVHQRPQRIEIVQSSEAMGDERARHVTPATLRSRSAPLRDQLVRAGRHRQQCHRRHEEIL